MAVGLPLVTKRWAAQFQKAAGKLSGNRLIPKRRGQIAGKIRIWRRDDWRKTLGKFSCAVYARQHLVKMAEAAAAWNRLRLASYDYEFVANSRPAR